MAKQVYLSSTYKDLKEYREIIRQMFTSKGLSNKYELVSMEGYVAESGKRSLDVCLDDVRKADIYILVLAEGYGATVDGMNISYTQAEYEEAKRIQTSRPGLYDVFVFYSAAESERFDFEGREDLKNDKLKEFYKKALADNARFLQPFTDSNSLCNQILLSLDNANSRRSLIEIVDQFLGLDPILGDQAKEELIKLGANCLDLVISRFGSLSRTQSLQIRLGELFGFFGNESLDRLMNVLQTGERHKMTDAS